MSGINRIFNQFARRITIVIFICLAWLISLSNTPVQADGYYSDKGHQVERKQPYYSTREHRVKVTESTKPYYSTKERKQQRVIKTQPGVANDYIDSRPQVRKENLDNR